MENEIWKPVIAYEGLYEVSSFGVVRRISIRGKPIEPRLMNPGVYGNVPYLRMILTRDGKCKDRTVHSVVCEAFHGAKTDGLWVRHLDGDHLNNAASNLAWGTPQENMRDQYRHGTRMRGKTNPKAKLDDAKVRELRGLAREGWTQTAIAKKFGVTQSAVWHVLRGICWAHVDGSV